LRPDTGVCRPQSGVRKSHHTEEIQSLAKQFPESSECGNGWKNGRQMAAREPQRLPRGIVDQATASIFNGRPHVGKPEYAPSVQSRKKPESAKKPAPKKPVAKKPTAGKKPPSKPPESQRPGLSDGDDEHQKRIQELCAKIDQAVADSALSSEKRHECGETAKAVFGKMTAVAVHRLHAHVTGFKFYESPEALTAAYQRKYPKTNLLRIKGAFDPDGTIHLDGDGILFGRRAAASELHAHEMTHAIDGNSHEISHGEQWKKAWEKEIRATEVFGKNGASQPEEGFAEFGQHLLGDPKGGRKSAKELCPRCFKVWESRGL
jgi:hypothetical protein